MMPKGMLKLLYTSLFALLALITVLLIASADIKTLSMIGSIYGVFIMFVFSVIASESMKKL